MNNKKYLILHAIMILAPSLSCEKTGNQKYADEVSLDFVEDANYLRIGDVEQKVPLNSMPISILEASTLQNQLKCIHPMSNHLNYLTKNSDLEKGTWFRKYNKDIVDFLSIYPIIDSIETKLGHRNSAKLGDIMAQIEESYNIIKEGKSFTKLEMFKYRMALGLLLKILECKDWRGNLVYVGDDSTKKVPTQDAQIVKKALLSNIRVLDSTSPEVYTLEDFKEPIYASFKNLCATSEEMRFSSLFPDSAVDFNSQKQNSIEFGPNCPLTYWSNARKSLVDGSWDSWFSISSEDSGIFTINKDISKTFNKIDNILEDIKKTIKNTSIDYEQKQFEIRRIVGKAKQDKGFMKIISKGLDRVTQLKKIINTTEIATDNYNSERNGLRWVGKWKTNSIEQIPTHIFKELTRHLDWLVSAIGLINYGENILIPINYTTSLLKYHEPWIMESDSERQTRWNSNNYYSDFAFDPFFGLW